MQFFSETGADKQYNVSLTNTYDAVGQFTKVSRTDADGTTKQNIVLNCDNASTAVVGRDNRLYVEGGVRTDDGQYTDTDDDAGRVTQRTLTLDQTYDGPLAISVQANVVVS